MTIKHSFFWIVAFLFLFTSSPFSFAADQPSVSQQRTEIIEKAKSDLVGIKEKLDKKRQEQVQAGDKKGAHQTQLRIIAANNLSNMLEAKSEAGGDIFKVELIQNYGPILNTQDFSVLSVREVMNYRMASPDEIYDGSSISSARAAINNSPNRDTRVLQAMEGRALHYASHQTYVVMHSGFVRGMANVSLAFNDMFADLNPATPFLEAGLGVKVSGEEIGRELSAGERAQAVGQGILETVVDYKVDQVVKGAVKGIGTQVGPGRTSGGSSKATPPKASLEGTADNLETQVTPSRPAGPGRVIGQADLNDVNNLDDIMPFTGLDNFNVDLRTGQITTGKTPGGRISPEGQAVIEQGLKPASPLGGDQKFDLQGQGTSATAVVPAPISPPVGREKVIGYVDLENVNDVMDMAGFTALENFNIDLRTGQVTSGGASGGRISPAGQQVIEQGLKPKGSLGGNSKDGLGIQNQTTQIDAQGQTTVMDGQVWGDVNKNLKMPKPDKQKRKPKEGLKPLWDLFDLKPEKGTEVPPAPPVGPVGLEILIFGPDGKAIPLDLNIFLDGFESGQASGWSETVTPFDLESYIPPNVDPAPGIDQPRGSAPVNDPFGDCFGPHCIPAFGGPVTPLGSQPIGAELHSSSGGPGSQFVSEDSLLNDPFFFDQRFGELFQGVPPSRDAHDQAN